MTNKSWSKYLGRPETYAWVFIVLGLLAMAFLFIERIKPGLFHVFDVSDTGNLGSLLSGTAGIFWALAGVLLFFSALSYQREDLSLQRQELGETRAVMKEQSETLKIQTFETTFFRLLENHRSLIQSLTFSDVVGYDGLNKFYTQTKSLISRYYQAAQLKKVEPDIVSHYHPVLLVRPQRENMEQIYFNVEQQILFIKSKLSDDTFYHQTLFNTLSKAEKYLLGLYCFNWQEQSLNVFNSTKFNYLKEFQDSGNSYIDSTTPIFPALKFDFKQSYIDLESGQHVFPPDEHSGFISITNVEPGLNKENTLVSIELIVPRSSKQEISELNADIEIRDVLEISIYDLLTRSLFPEVLTQLNNPDHAGIVHIPFDLVFHVKCKGTLYRYINHCRCQVSQRNERPSTMLLQVNR